MEKNERFWNSFTFKGFIIVVLSLLLLIPTAMIQMLISERQDRSVATIHTINEKWSDAQTLCAPILVVPYTTTKIDCDNKPYLEEYALKITPDNLKIDVNLEPEEKYYGIYKAILYKSNIHFSGDFSALQSLSIENSEIHFDKARFYIGITDLKGVTMNPICKINDTSLEPTIEMDDLFSRNNVTQTKMMMIELNDLALSDSLYFDCSMQLNGSGEISFIPVAQTTTVNVEGKWTSPSFIGGFSPQSSIDEDSFTASWSILSFNREIPKMWSDHTPNFEETSFGVNLIETVDHYQQNMRTAKYAILFIILTFIVFFFVELFTKKKIRFFQYVLVGIALVLFYTLLLSLSEQIGFGWSYLIAAIATIAMIVTYFYSIIKERIPTFILAGIMLLVYAFLYCILQIEDYALLFGSIFLFVVLGVIMFASNKIKESGK